MPMTGVARRTWSRIAPGAIRAHLDHLSDPVGHFDLDAVERELRTDPAFEAEGHCAVTLAKYTDLRVVLLTMRGGAHLGEASTAARLSVQALRGRAVLELPEGPIDLRAGQLATLERGMTHDVRAAEDCALLLTLAWVGQDELVLA
jgi:hypothetical protein